jgi:hypothetical protein
MDTDFELSVMGFDPNAVAEAARTAYNRLSGGKATINLRYIPSIVLHANQHGISDEELWQATATVLNHGEVAPSAKYTPVLMEYWRGPATPFIVNGFAYVRDHGMYVSRSDDGAVHGHMQNCSSGLRLFDRSRPPTGWERVSAETIY